MNKKKLKKLSNHLAIVSNLLYELGWKHEMRKIDEILETVEEFREERVKPRSITEDLI